ncbi:hypothetical protein MKW94_014437 [Papaver nudicaule]|uniref:Uncharacterized protein n=1 Tax=Papaver nudicaule TaxID=74823 RepID=A0AA41W2S7_PAPNU|nr:hypothetical protein [Papaver nudicaule]
MAKSSPIFKKKKKKSSPLFFSFFICFILISFVAFAPYTSFCQEKCQKLAPSWLLDSYGCERKPKDKTFSYCICCFELDICDSGSRLSSFSSKLLFRGLGQ